MVLSFEKDIRPLFRDTPDVDSMKDYGLDPSSYEDVKAQAGAIQARLQDGSMPCDGPWLQEQLDLFKRWMEEGMAPNPASMDKRSLDRFRKSLKDQRDALHLRLVRVRRQPSGLGASEVKDEGDRANASLAQEMTVLERTQAENLLRAVHAALNRIDTGTLGECRDCGQEIGVKRLEAIPWTRYCVRCQGVIDAG